ncbi:hypothetical protein [Sphingobium sp. CFD-2]|uniref:hypothetical protein n=1 Tax=Sphingobium sp. CFD-2 TaxID=2878542 RepID=UPI00214CE0BF|nr:hypothetical protein [Sphingobium sp. CFD-2]
MKHQHPFRPHSVPSRKRRSWVALALALLTIVLAAVVVILYREGYVADGLLPSMICFIAAVAIGAVAAAQIEGQEPEDPYRRYREIAPPSDVYSVWPLTIRLPSDAGRFDGRCGRRGKRTD